MFSGEELQRLAGCCYRELSFYREIEAAGVPTVIDQARVSQLRAKCLEEAAKLAKAEQANAKANEPVPDGVNEPV